LPQWSHLEYDNTNLSHRVIVQESMYRLVWMKKINLHEGARWPALSLTIGGFWKHGTFSRPSRPCSQKQSSNCCANLLRPTKHE
jgi:hypothetical protein